MCAALSIFDTSNMVTTRMVAAALVVLLVACGNSLSSGQELPQDTTKENASEELRSDSRSGGPRTATFIPAFVLANVSSKQRQRTPEVNDIGKSPCPRGSRGEACRRELARNALTCTSGSCKQCSRGCSSVEASLWPTCCRDHFLCCRQLVSACQRCDTPQLISFCTAAFKRCI